MLKGLAITPPVLGRISIGKVIEKNGKRLPEKDDQFTITTQVQSKDGWLPHPCDEGLRKEQGGKIRQLRSAGGQRFAGHQAQRCLDLFHGPARSVRVAHAQMLQ